LNSHADDITKPTPLGGTPTVFLPFITTTHAPLLECDYNLHKSNSTYFTDLDASRSHLLSALCYRGLRTVDSELTAEGKPGILAAIIGSVTTSFKREIPMFRQYEVWSRILTWDQKWIYIVTHFVQKGAVEPKRFLAGAPAAPAVATVKGDDSGQSERQSSSAFVYATSVSKYVFKKGRLTVPPERVLRASGLFCHGGISGCAVTTDIAEDLAQNKSSKGVAETRSNSGDAYSNVQDVGQAEDYLNIIE
jgi:hypothetical protein